MKKETKAINTPYQRHDVFDVLELPVYHALAYDFDDASNMYQDRYAD